MAKWMECWSRGGWVFQQHVDDSIGRGGNGCMIVVLA